MVMVNPKSKKRSTGIRSKFLDMNKLKLLMMSANWNRTQSEPNTALKISVINAKKVTLPDIPIRISSFSSLHILYMYILYMIYIVYSIMSIWV